jgi:hypothetical protein
MKQHISMGFALAIGIDATDAFMQYKGGGEIIYEQCSSF